MYNAVIFDFDGTIADTKEGIIKGARYALKKYGIATQSDEELMIFVGPPLWYTFETYYGFDKTLQDEAVAVYREYYTSKGIYEAHLYEGIEELLKSLKMKGVQTGIASAKIQQSVEEALGFMGIKNYFDVVVGNLPDGTRSDKSELIRLALDKMQINECVKTVVVGDSRTDALGAYECGMEFIAALYDRNITEFDGIKLEKKAYTIKELADILLV